MSIFKVFVTKKNQTAEPELPAVNARQRVADENILLESYKKPKDLSQANLALEIVKDDIAQLLEGIRIRQQLDEDSGRVYYMWLIACNTQRQLREDLAELKGIASAAAASAASDKQAKHEALIAEHEASRKDRLAKSLAKIVACENHARAKHREIMLQMICNDLSEDAVNRYSREAHKAIAEMLDSAAA